METPPDALQMPNTFPARERVFISNLAAELHLEVTWDEYDDEDQNLVTFRLPGTVREAQSGVNGDKISAENGTEDDEEEWVDESEESEDDDAEAVAAVDRVLKKYEKAKVVEEEEEDFDTRHARAVQERMDEWKRGYYRVSQLHLLTLLPCLTVFAVIRKSWRFRMMIRSRWVN